jgi:hypothetical protein
LERRRFTATNQRDLTQGSDAMPGPMELLMISVVILAFVAIIAAVVKILRK